MPALVAVVVIASLAVFGAISEPSGEVGPVITRLGPADATIVWESDHEGPGKITWTPLDGVARDERTVASVVTTVDDADGGPESAGPKVGFLHKARLCGLQPGTTYTYQVRAGPDTSDNCRFRTPLAAGDPRAARDEMVFAVYGDSRRHPQVHRSIVEQMSRLPLQFVINTGDVAGFGKKFEEYEEEFLEPLSGLADHVPVFTARGNHDPDPLFSLVCQNGPGPANFSFDRGNAHFTVLDNAEGRKADEGLLEWAEKDLRASSARWKFVIYHVPTLNMGGHRSAWHYPEAVALWDRLGVDFVLVGHSHIYERFRPILATDDATRGTTYITTGGGGATLYENARSTLLAASAEVHHFCVFHIIGDTLRLDTLSASGDVLDRVTVQKSGPDGAMQKAFLDLGVTMRQVDALMKASAPSLAPQTDDD